MASLDRLTDSLRRIIWQAPLLPVATAFAAAVAITVAVGHPLIVATAFSLGSVLLAIFRQSIPSVMMAVGAIACVDTRLNLPDTEITNDFSSANLFYKADILTASETDYVQTAGVKLLEWSADSIIWHKSPRMEAIISVPDFHPALKPGYEVSFRTKLKPIDNTTDLPDETDPSNSRLDRRILLRAVIPPAEISLGKASDGWRQQLLRIKHSLTDRILSSPEMSPGAKEFVTTALLGESSRLSPPTRDIFSGAGLSHILALSGLHVDIIAAIIALALWPLRVFRRNVAGLLITVTLLWLYAALTGFSPSVTRAVIMASFFLIGRILQRKSTPQNSLCAAALFILLFDPLALFSPGFQLSFAAVASILIFADMLNPVPRSNKTAYAIMSLLTVSVSAVMGTALVSIFHFHTFPLYFIPANLAVLLILPWLLGASAVWLALDLCGMDAGWLCEFINTLYSFVESVARCIASLPGAMARGISVGWPTASLFILTLAALWAWLRLSRQAFGVAFALCLVATATAFCFQKHEPRNPRLYVTRQTYRTDIVIDTGCGPLNLLTTAPMEAEAVKARAMRRYERFMLSRGIDSVRTMGLDNAQGPGFTIQNGVLHWGSTTLAIANGAFRFAGSADYVIVCRGYRGNIGALLDCVSADTVILSHDLHPRRRANYLEECSRLGEAVIDMGQRGWSLGYRPRSSR